VFFKVDHRLENSKLPRAEPSPPRQDSKISKMKKKIIKENKTFIYYDVLAIQQNFADHLEKRRRIKDPVKRMNQF
jgi:hypothetical protein